MKAMQTLLFTGVLAATFGAYAAQEYSQTGQTGSAVSSDAQLTDKSFATQAAQSGLAEVDMGKIAQNRASNPAVKQFAEQLVTAHSESNEKLKQIAKEESITLPKSLTREDQKLKNSLNKLSGTEFDKRFMAAQVKDHEKAIDLFQREADSGKSEQMKQFAQETLPHLQSHLDEAKKISADIAAFESGGTSQ